METNDVERVQKRVFCKATSIEPIDNERFECYKSAYIFILYNIYAL